MRIHTNLRPSLHVEGRLATPRQSDRNVKYQDFVQIDNVIVSHHQTKGLMLVATKSLHAGNVITNALAFRMEAEERRRVRNLSFYKFVFLDPDEEGADERGGYVAFGPISFCNHAGQPNAEVRWAIRGCHAVLTMCAMHLIHQGSEVTMRYANVEEYPGSEQWI